MHSVNRRVLIVDDNADIHADFRKILAPVDRRPQLKKLETVEAALFADEPPDSEEDPPLSAAETPHVVYELDFAFQGAEALAKVEAAFAENRPYALIFMDVRMPPGMDGVETIAHIWARRPNVEIVICSAYTDYSFDAVLQKLGTSDRLLFLSKPFDPIAVKQMAMSLSYKWTLHEQAKQQLAQLEYEARQRRASEHRLHELIHRDNITGLGNRRCLAVDLNSAITAARRAGTRFALLWLELVRFHEVIDTLGHRIADRLIARVGERLSTCFADRGTLFHQAGNEFSLLTTDLHGLDDAGNLADMMVAEFEEPFDENGFSVNIQVAVGAAIFPDHGASADMLMRHADMAVMHARRSEKGYCYYDTKMNKFSPQRLMLLADLRNAIHNDDLLLYYQPKLNLADESVVGVEALTRWAHAILGFVPPADFIPVAEQCGLIKPLTRWVMQRAGRQWRAWADQGLDLKITLNLTAQDLQIPRLHRHLAELLESTGMPAEYLGLEVSEPAMMHDRRQAAITLHRVHDLGISVTIDQFGTGYSSLAYLKHLPVDEIKIDGSFITHLATSENDQAIVRSMIDLGHNLGLVVSADGVATRRDFDLLKAFGCDGVQGHFINAPVPPGELNLWLMDAHWPHGGRGAVVGTRSAYALPGGANSAVRPRLR